MKIYRYIILTFFAIGLFVSCEKNEISMPTACCETYIALPDGTLQLKETFQKGQSIIFKSCYIADQYAIWTGDTGHDYDAPHGGTGANKGASFETTDGTYTYTYAAAGTYKVVFIATNTLYSGDQKQAMISFNITITE